MKHTIRKLRTLTVKRETLRQLDHQQLDKVIGGGDSATGSFCNSVCEGHTCVAK